MNSTNHRDPSGLNALVDFVTGFFWPLADGDENGDPTTGGTLGGVARDAVIDEGIGRRLGRPGQAAGLGAVVTVTQGLDAAAKAAGLLKDAAYWRVYQELLERQAGGENVDPYRDCLYRALTKIREGRAGELTPKEAAALDRRINQR